jgi:hypothetical protein
VASTFNVEYSENGMSNLLHRLGYTYKKPKLVPAKPDEAEQDFFLSCYLEFMKNKPEDVKVFFVDAVHPTHNTMAQYGWMRKGETRALASNSGRGRFNIHGAMDAETYETTTVLSEENVNADSTIALFEILEKIYPFASALYLIVDNARYHFAPSVIEYLKTSRIQLVPLPTYSPELNLIERLWRVFKRNVLYNKFYKAFEEFKRACAGFFERQACYRDEIESAMGDGLEALAA